MSSPFFVDRFTPIVTGVQLHACLRKEREGGRGEGCRERWNSESIRVRGGGGDSFPKFFQRELPQDKLEHKQAGFDCKYSLRTL